jgi:hypothetical protein
LPPALVLAARLAPARIIARIAARPSLAVAELRSRASLIEIFAAASKDRLARRRCA